MTKDFIPYEQALSLKELGFDEPCFGYYYTLNGKDWKFAEKSEYYRLDDEINIGSKFSLLAPTFSQAFRWFRDKYKLHSYISLGISNEQDRSELEYDEYTYVIEGLNGLDYDNYGEGLFSKTHEEAQLICLQQLIQIVKNVQ